MWTCVGKRSRWLAGEVTTQDAGGTLGACVWDLRLSNEFPKVLAAIARVKGSLPEIQDFVLISLLESVEIGKNLGAEWCPRHLDLETTPLLKPLLPAGDNLRVVHHVHRRRWNRRS